MTKDLAKVLILEDLPTDVELIQRQVRRVSENVVFAVARSKSEFLETLQWFEPDLILADYRLPDSNGLEALLHVRQHHAGTPFIFVTGTLNNEEKVAEAVLKGASGYILKHNLNKLSSKLQEVWEDYIIDRNQEEERRRRDRENALLLQKCTALLEGAKFDNRDEVLSILHSISRNLADKKEAPSTT